MRRFMSKYSSDHYVLFLSRSLVTPRHLCIIMHKVVNESLRKICYYQQNVPQHYYLLDTLVIYHILLKTGSLYNEIQGI